MRPTPCPQSRGDRGDGTVESGKHIGDGALTKMGAVPSSSHDRDSDMGDTQKEYVRDGNGE